QSQQEQLELLKGELAKRDRQIDEAREAAAAANARAAEANTKAAEAANSSAEVKTAAVTLPTPVSDLKASNEGLKTAVSAESAQTRGAGPETSPLQLHIGDASITPIGFADFTGVWRSRGGGSGIGRASCRERVVVPVVDVAFQDNDEVGEDERDQVAEADATIPERRRARDGATRATD